MTDWNNLKPPAAPVLNDPGHTSTLGWGVPPQPIGAVPPIGVPHEAQLPTYSVKVEWVTPSQEPIFDESKYLAPQLTEALWTATVLDSSNTRASVVNSLAGTKDAFNIDQDGELTRMKEIATGEKPMGYYVAYSNGKWLHAILSGPYDSLLTVAAWEDPCYELLINDAAFKLAFGNEFNRDGIYTAQIPLSAKRHGAYGVLS